MSEPRGPKIVGKRRARDPVLPTRIMIAIDENAPHQALAIDRAVIVTSLDDGKMNLIDGEMVCIYELKEIRHVKKRSVELI